MSNNAVHTSPDLFDQDRTNVYDPNTTERIGHIHHTDDGDITISTRSRQMSIFDNVSESYGHLKSIKRKRAKNHVDPWIQRMNQYYKNHDKF